MTCWLVFQTSVVPLCVDNECLISLSERDNLIVCSDFAFFDDIGTVTAPTFSKQVCARGKRHLFNNLAQIVQITI